MINETALGFYAYKGLTIAIVSSQRIPCLFNERQRHMVSNHSGMYTEYQPSVSEYVNKVLTEADQAGPFAETQGRIENNQIAYVLDDIVRSLLPRYREVLYTQIQKTFLIAGNETQDLHNWYISDALQDSIDRAVIRDIGVHTFEAYLFALSAAQVKIANPGLGWWGRLVKTADRRKEKDILRRFETVKAFKKESKK